MNPIKMLQVCYPPWENYYYNIALHLQQQHKYQVWVHSGVMRFLPLHLPTPPHPLSHPRATVTHFLDRGPPLTLGLLPPMAPGRIEPVSWYRQRILETQPWETRSCREITQGRMPWWAISTILCRMWFGRGLPLMNTPPSWFTLPWPRGVDTAPQQ